MKENIRTLRLGDILKDAKNIDDVRAILKNKLPDVEYTVKKTLDTKNNKFNVNYGYNYFPQKTYKGINYDEGYYAISVNYNIDGSTNHTETRKIKFFVTEKCKHSKITF